MKVLVCGSRNWPNIGTIHDRLRDLLAERGPFEVIHGGARGADAMAALTAQWCRLPARAFPADWDKHGKRAGILRNLAMLDEGPDLVLAFQRNGSRGTQHTIDEARRRGIPVEVFTA